MRREYFPNDFMRLVLPLHKNQTKTLKENIHYDLIYVTTINA